MTTSITILSRKNYCEKDTASSSSSSFSSSPQNPLNSLSSTSIHRHDRRPRLLSSSLSKQEHTVINVGDPNGVPRLITCVRCSQGYEWNPEIFLPPYIDYEFESLERKRDPVHEIRLSDEEMNKMLPQ